MNYNIFDRVAPAMPSPSKGTEICKLLLSQASKDMRETLVSMFLYVLCAHLCFTKNQSQDLILSRNVAKSSTIYS